MGARARTGIRLIPCHHRPEIVCVFGKIGAGKSSDVVELLRGRSRVIVVDPLREYAADDVFESTVELLNYIAGRRRFEVVYRFPAGVDKFDRFPLLLEIALVVGELTLVVDEVGLVLRRERLPKIWDEVVNQGRHRGLKIIAAAQRFTKVNRDFTASATQLRIFRTSEPADVRYFAEFIGKAAALALKDLPDHTPYVWTDGAKTP